MHPRDKAVLRLTIGMGLAAFIAYAIPLQVPYVACLLAVVVLCKPGPPLPVAKAVVVAFVMAGLVAAGILMVPLLEHFAFAGVLLTAVLLFALFFLGQLRKQGLTTLLVLAFTMIPVAGVGEQALVGVLAKAIGVGFFVGAVVSAFSAALFPDPPRPAPALAAADAADRDAARWIALRGTLIVMPVFVLALTNPSFYMAAIMKTVALGQQAGEAHARTAGRELVGSTLVGALLALVAWFGLKLSPNLWMLVLWLMALALWTGTALFGLRATRFPPSFWSNALITALILFGPAIEDSASGKSVLEGGVMRVTLFVGVALYAWATVWALERWRGARAVAPAGDPIAKEVP